MRRLSDSDLENHRVYVDGNRALRSARDDSVFDTRGGSTHWGGGGSDRAIVVDGNGNIYASKYQAVGDIHHSTLGNGGPVGGGRRDPGDRRARRNVDQRERPLPTDAGPDATGRE